MPIPSHLHHIDPEFAPLLASNGLRPLVLGGRALLSVLQGGMGIGASGYRRIGLPVAWPHLAASAPFRRWTCGRHHPDLMERLLMRTASVPAA